MLLISFSLEEIPISYSFVTPSSIHPACHQEPLRFISFGKKSSTPCKLGFVTNKERGGKKTETISGLEAGVVDVW
jgi:hypothetical protein